MANSMAVLMIETDKPIMMVCADGTGIAKGQCLKLNDNMVVSATSATDDEFGGIAAAEKIASDGMVKIPVYRKGVFLCEAGTTGVTVAKPVKIEANNEFRTAAANDSDLGYNWGVALETATDGQLFMLELKS